MYNVSIVVITYLPGAIKTFRISVKQGNGHFNANARRERFFSLSAVIKIINELK